MKKKTTLLRYLKINILLGVRRGVMGWRGYSALIWQKEASDKSDISRKRAKCVCHLHWRQWNIRMSYLTYLLVGWVFLHEIWRRRRAHYVNYENINNSNLDGMSLASFCQSRAVLPAPMLLAFFACLSAQSRKVMMIIPLPHYKLVIMLPPNFSEAGAVLSETFCHFASPQANTLVPLRTCLML